MMRSAGFLKATGVAALMALQPLAAMALLPSTALAQVATSNPVPGVTPLEVEVLDVLRFGDVTAATAEGGSVTLEAATGRQRLSRGMVDRGGFGGVARLRVTGEPERYIRILLPDAYTLSTDPVPLWVEGFTASPGTQVRLDSRGRAEVRIGATLRAEGRTNQASQRISVPVDIEYVPVADQPD